VESLLNTCQFLAVCRTCERSSPAFGTSRAASPYPLLAAVDLAERQAIANGYAQPAQRMPRQRPSAHMPLIGSWIALFVVEELTELATESIRNGYLGNPASVLVNPYLYHDDWWRYIANAFLHSTNFIPHVLFNGLAMFYIGGIVERLYGRLVLVATFLVTCGCRLGAMDRGQPNWHRSSPWNHARRIRRHMRTTWTTRRAWSCARTWRSLKRNRQRAVNMC